MAEPLADRPEWFDWAMAQAPETLEVDVSGASIELLAWGERGRRGVLLLHGNLASADWWRHIAPFLAEDFRVAALSWSGMGRSGWRDRYSTSLYVEEAFAAAQSAGLFEAGPPLVFGHSFGGDLGWACAASDGGNRLAGVVTLDSIARGPADLPPIRRSGPRIYDSLEDAVASYRLAGSGAEGDPAVVRMIAERAFRRTEDGRFTANHDPRLWEKYDRHDSGEVIARARCRLVLAFAERTWRSNPAPALKTQGYALEGAPSIILPATGHHIPIEQPLALVYAMRTLCATLIEPQAMQASRRQ